VPNEVYRAAVAGLSGLVPPRVAQRLVDEALVATRRTPEDVSLPAMRKLLLGPVRKELEGVLPPGAAGPGLKRVAAELEHGGARQRRWWRPGRPGGAEASGERGARRQRPRSPDAPPPTATPPVPALAAAAKAAAVAGPSPSARSTQVRLVEPEEAAAIEAAVAAEAGAPPASAAGVTTVALPARRADRGPEPAAPLLPRLDDDLVERALRAFGALETVRQVVAVRGGKGVLGRGEGVDASALPALALATSRLLNRGGPLRTFALERPTGALFLFPLADGGLVVLTKPKVNVGAVLAARAALEEAA